MESNEKDNIGQLTSKDHITSLNTFCLIHIFQYLDTWELVKLSEVHSTFFEIINQHIIGQRPFILCLTTLYYSVERMLQTFGASIRELQLSTDVFLLGSITLLERMSCSDAVFELIARYCKKLRKLHLRLEVEKPINLDVLKRAAPILSDLELLDIYFITGSDDYCREIANSILELCPKLREISILGIDLGFESLKQLTQLTSLELNLCDQWDIVKLREILERNPRIKKIELHGLSEWDNFINTLIFLAQTNTIIDLSLKWWTMHRDIYRGDIKKRQEIKQAMTAFTSLKRIYFRVYDDKNCIIISDMVRSLPNLTECTFDGEISWTVILSSVTEKLEILRLKGTPEPISARFYQKLLKVKKSCNNNCLRLFLQNWFLKGFIKRIDDEYQPEELKILPF